jgi:hypothetical protein
MKRMYYQRGSRMNRSFKTILIALLVASIAMFWIALVVSLCWFIPAMRLLEILFVMSGSILLAIGGVILAQEVSKFVDLRHWQRYRQRVRELELQELEHEHLQIKIRPRRSSRSRYF